MSEENIFDIEQRTKEFFQLHNTNPPAPAFGEEPTHYHRRLLNCAQAVVHRGVLTDAGRAWADTNIGLQPQRALKTAEQALIHDTAEQFKRPIGPLRQVTERVPNSGGREIIRFYGDPENCWGRFAGVRQRVVGFSSAGRGASSPKGQALAAARANALRAAGLL